MKLPKRTLSINTKHYDVILLQRALGKLKYAVPEEEKKSGTFGDGTQKAVSAFQQAQGLRPTGELDAATLQKLNQAMAARAESLPKRELLQVKKAKDIAPIRFPLRLNMSKDNVLDLQKALAYFKLEIDAKEATERKYGRSTVKAVKTFQKEQGLPETGEVDRKTAMALNGHLKKADPSAKEAPMFRIRGSVRNELWQGKQNVRVQLFEKGALRDEKLIAERIPLANGFYDVKYTPPMAGDKTFKPLVVKIVDDEGAVLKTVTIDAPSQTMWINYTEGDRPFVKKNDFEELFRHIKPELGQLRLEQLEESTVHQDLTYLSDHTGKSKEDLMKLALSHRMGETSGLSPVVCYAFVRQNLPASLPGALVESTQQWQLIDRLVENTLLGIALMEPALQRKAIEAAVTDNLVPRGLLTQMDAVLEQLRQLRVDFTLLKPILVGNASLRSVLQQSALKQEAYNRFSELYAEHRGTGDGFWKALEAEPAVFPEPTIKDLQRTFAIAAVAKNHMPTVAFLKPLYTVPMDLAKLDHGDWVGLIKKHIERGGEGYPESVDGATKEEKINAYAAILKSKAQDLYPTAAFLSSMTRNKKNKMKSLAMGDNLQSLLDKVPDFDLRNTQIDVFLKERAEQIQLEPEAVSDLRMMQRAIKMAPTVDTGVALLENNWHSSSHIYFQGPDRFAEKFTANGFTNLEARKVYSLASRNYAMLLAKVTEMRAEFQQLTPQSILPWTLTSEQKALLQDFPSLEVLFGTLDYCTCSDCRSVYSPAAYLVDILRFLNEKDAIAAGKTAKHVLFNRRRDIEELELSCENTNVVLPYIDLVNELLEETVAPPPAFSPFVLNTAQRSKLDAREIDTALRNAFAPKLTDRASVEVLEKGQRWSIAEPAYRYTIRWEDGALKVKARTRQTTRTAAELAANPEYVNGAAYDKLAQQVYPWKLPFHLWREEIRVYLGHLGGDRATLTETLSAVADRSQVLKDAAIACERLGLAPIPAAIVTGGSGTVDGLNLAAVKPWMYWGFETEDVSVGDPTDPGTTVKGKWHQVICRVDILLRQSGLFAEEAQSGGAYVRLLELMDSHYVNPAAVSGQRQLVIESMDPADPFTCDLSKLIVKSSAASTADQEAQRIAAFDRMHRFVRLAASAGLTFRELDRLIGRLASGTLDSAFLVRLSHAQRLRQDWGVPIADILAWWGPIETAGYRSPDESAATEVSHYERLFRNRTVNGQPSSSFELNAAGTELLKPHTASEPNSLSGNRMAIAAALSIGETEFMLLLKELALADEMKLSHLSQLYRHVSIARALKLSVADYVSIRRTTGMDPFAWPDTSRTLLFLEQARELTLGGFAAPDLAFLIRHERAVPSASAPSDADVAGTLAGIRAELHKVAEDNAFAADPDGKRTGQKLEQLSWNASVTEPFIALLAGTAAFETELASLPAGVKIPKNTLVYNVAGKKLSYTGVLTTALRDELLTLSDQAAYKAAVGELFNLPRNFVKRNMRTFRLPTFSAFLAALPLGVQIPSAIRSRVYYDASSKRLRSIGALSEADVAKLNALSADPVYQAALKQLAEWPEDGTYREHAVFLETLPEGVELPVELKPKLFYDEAAKQLRALGILTVLDKKALLALSRDADYQAAVNELELRSQIAPEAAETFLTDADIVTLFDSLKAGAERFAFVLGKLLPYIRKTSGNGAVVQVLADALKLEASTTELLTTRLCASPADTGPDPLLRRRVMADFLDPAFAESSLHSPIMPTSFEAAFRSALLLHKIAAVVRCWKLEPELLRFLMDNADRGGWLRLDALPVPAEGEPVPSTTFQAWGKLQALIDVRTRAKLTDGALISLLGIALETGDSASAKEKNVAKSRFFGELAGSAGIPTVDAVDLLGLPADHASTGLLAASFPADYRNPALLQRLFAAAQAARLLGATPATVKAWVKPSPNATDADSVKQAAKAKYDEQRWLAIAKPLRDPMREKQRDALAAYLLARPLAVAPNVPAWDSLNGMYAHFLIDVEMSPLQMTSRLKQATASVQLFVQRCQMNLETREIKAKPSDGWDQWKWMKNYRVWEANRKVFLYPENWLEPELRDDKSDFFKQLENDITQNEITDEHVETALLAYLEKVDEVSRLDICSMYHEIEGNRNIVHVLARTKATPTMYYYRKFIDNTFWSGWEKLDLGIESEHATIVVYNRKLHIVWPVFIEKMTSRQMQPPAQPSAKAKHAPETPRYWEIQLGWTVMKSGNWEPKKISKRKLIHPWQRPVSSYHIKTRERNGYLWVDIFLSTSPDFNNNVFYIPNEDAWKLKTATPFDETARPWHSSSFVFNGDVVEALMKDLNGSVTNEVMKLYGEEGRSIGLLGRFDKSPRQILPAGMHYRNTQLVNNTHHLNLDDLNVVSNHWLRVDNGRLLDSANSPFNLVITQQDAQFDSQNRPFFYEDRERSFFIKPLLEYKVGNYFTTDLPSNPGGSQYRIRYTLYPFYHPYTTLFIRELKRFGLPGLFSRTMQTEPHKVGPGNSFDFVQEYKPIAPSAPSDSAKKEIIDFSADGAYSLYNWELFLHAPLMIAMRLSQNQRFEEAMKWFHFIFDPTSADDKPSPQKYWKTKPFFDYTTEDYRNQRIETLLKLINAKSPGYEKQVDLWRKNPFNPHLAARLRPIAYQRNVVMKYIDNLIGWADQLFRQDTIESINEATLLYVLAAEILGRRPARVPSRQRIADMSYKELESKLDAFGNSLVEVENLLPPAIDGSAGSGGDEEPLPRLETFYFGIPHNDRLLDYWDRVEDRLFKIRHSLNIDGKFRTLPLFDPPIDPGMLIKASAAGVDIGNLLSDMNVPHPHYRFPYMLQKAQQLNNEVKAIGAQMLSALEKKDAEEIARIRGTHEVQLLENMRAIKELEIKEQEEVLSGLEKSLEAANQKVTFYTNLSFMNAWEYTAMALSGASTLLDSAIAIGYIAAGGLKLIPNFVIGAAGFGGSPTAHAETGGDKIGETAEAAVKTMSAISHSLDKMANISSTMASYYRRKEEWDQQKALAEIEVKQIERQMEGTRVRIEITKKNLSQHNLQIENAKSVQQFMQSKFTNTELYQWMVGQLSTVFFQSYQLAYDMAKRAEKSFRFELGLQDSSYIRFGYWDSLKKGLLAGEKMAYDLNRMDAAYSELNARQLELVKHVSLAQTAPFSLLKLKENGECLVELPEWLFDLDYPGHYMRRLKTVSVSIPCTTGPYAGINCTLSLVSSSIRIDPSAGGNYLRSGIDDPRFIDQYGVSQAIATSSGVQDSGMFQLNFNDERYLPFEGAGAVGLWRIEMPHDCNPIDFTALPDVVLHLHYTARDAGHTLATAARNGLKIVLPEQGIRLFDLKRDFGTEWYKFLHSARSDEDQELRIAFESKHVAFFDRNKTLKVTAMHVVAACAKSGGYTLAAKPPGSASGDVPLTTDAMYGTAHHGEKLYTPGSEPSLKGQWTFKLKENAATDYRSLQENDIESMYLIVQYKTS